MTIKQTGAFPTSFGFSLHAVPSFMLLGMVFAGICNWCAAVCVLWPSLVMQRGKGICRLSANVNVMPLLVPLQFYLLSSILFFSAFLCRCKVARNVKGEVIRLALSMWLLMMA